ncbi:MAG: hypothetical protein ACK5V3_14235, partial [Bdellovibrionales bacterium]
ILVLRLLSCFLREHDNPITTEVNETKAIDQMLGDGQIAAPSELINAVAIDGLMDKTAFANLYSIHPQTMKANKKVATQVRLARSPKDPLKFFVIINENQLQQLLNKEGPYYAVLQNRRRSGPAQFADENSISKIKYQFQSVGEL